MKKITLCISFFAVFSALPYDRYPVDLPTLFIYLNSGVEKLKNPVSARNVLELEKNKVIYLFRNLTYDASNIPTNGNFTIYVNGSELNTTLSSRTSGDTVIVDATILSFVASRYKFVLSGNKVTQILEYNTDPEVTGSRLTLEKIYYPKWADDQIEDLQIEDYVDDEVYRLLFVYENSRVVSDTLYTYDKDADMFELTNKTQFYYFGSVIDSAVTFIGMGPFLFPIDIHAFKVNEDDKVVKQTSLNVFTSATNEIELSNSNLTSLSNQNFASGLKVSYSKDKQVINCSEKVSFDLYNANGNKVASNLADGSSVAHLDKGIYIVNSPQGNAKLVIY